MKPGAREPLEADHMDDFEIPGASGPLKARLEAYERHLIRMALAASGGNQRRAAVALGLLPTTLHEKMKRLGLIRRASPSEDELPQEASA